MDVFFAVLSSAAIVFLLPVQGVSAIAAALIVLAYHRYSAYRDFGGVTGDLCGCLIIQLGLLLLIGCRIVLR